MHVKYKYPQTVEAELKTINLHVKCTDSFFATFYDANGNLILEHEGDVPGFFPGRHHGEYLILNIDPATGRITNWNATAPDVGDFIEEKLSEG